jgi:Glycosyltransferase family 17
MLTDGRRLVDSFLFSEAHESEVLLAKLHAGGVLIDEFVAIESCYTFRGEYKGFWLAKALDTDPRFIPFRNKVTVIECKRNLFEEVGKTHNEDGYFRVEFASRELSRDYIYGKYSDTDLVTCTDVDELLDCSDPVRSTIINTYLVRSASMSKIAWIQILKFWYDFDNACCEYKWYPVAPISVTRETWRLRQAPDRLVEVYKAPPFLAFEFSYCFPRNDIWRKLNTFAHNEYVEQDLDDALKNNHWIKCKKKGQYVGDREGDTFRTVPLTPLISTKYVLDNFERLRTRNVGNG